MSDYPIDDAKKAARELIAASDKRELELTRLLLDAVKMLRDAKPIMIIAKNDKVHGAASWLSRYTGLMARIDEATERR